jgi:predicted Zn-dependent protease
MRLIAPTVTALALALAACSTVSKVTEGAKELAADVLLPVEDEIKLGEQLSAEVEKESKVSTDKQLQAYVAGLGAEIAKAAGPAVPKGMKLKFTVIDDDKQVNAFALPGGHIYVYSALLKLADNEAEVMGVLGHEVAHVTERHVAERLVAAQGLQAVLEMATGKKPGLVGQLAQAIIGQGTLIQFTRGQESDADAKGLPYVVRADYSPNGFVTFFEKLKKDEGASWLKWLQDHPLPSERIEAAKKRIASLKSKPSKTGEADYEKIKASHLK